MGLLIAHATVHDTNTSLVECMTLFVQYAELSLGIIDQLIRQLCSYCRHCQRSYVTYFDLTPDVTRPC